VKKDLIFNIELTSKCNYLCSICPHRYYQFSNKNIEIKTFIKFTERLLEAGKDFKIREIINSGYGETFLHDNLKLLFFIYKDFKIQFKRKFNYTPKISIVTNASQITKEKLNHINQSNDILKISFPTCNVNNYSKITNVNKELGKDCCRKVKHNIRLCMNNVKDIRFHISPPTIESFNDLENTILYLIETSIIANRKNLDIVIFPNASNRAGNITVNHDQNVYKYIKKYNNKIFSGLKINISTEFKVFYPNFRSVIFTLTKKFPCFWRHGSLSMDIDGNYRHCINDTFCENKIGNINNKSIKKVVKEINYMGKLPHCDLCNQHPAKIENKILNFICHLNKIT